MKKLICLGLMTLLVNVAYCQQKEESSKALNQDEAAVQKVLIASRAAFDKRDLTTFGTYFSKSPTLYYQVFTTDRQLIMAHGWEAMTHMVSGYMKDHPEPDKGIYAVSNAQIHVNGNTAWVHSGGKGGVPGQEQMMAQDFFVFEKQAGHWKIAALTSQQYKEGELTVIK